MNRRWWLKVFALGLIVISLFPGLAQAGEVTQVGSKAPDFTLANLDGESVSLSDFRGGSVLINFWATWCPPCCSEMPYIQQTFEQWGSEGPVILAINIGESHSAARKFAQEQKLSLPILLDSEKKAARDYQVRYIPTTFLIDKEGKIQAIKIGAFRSKAELEDFAVRVNEEAKSP
jgi:peroxiredoxin